MMRWRALIGYSFVFLLALDAAAQDPPPSVDREVLLREAWTRGSERFAREWLVLGPLPAPEDAGAPQADPVARAGAAHPRPGDTYDRPGRAPLRWTPHASYSDVIDLRSIVPREDAAAVAAPPRRGRRPARTERTARGTVAYAFATIVRAREGDALLSLGSDEGLRVWVNGALVHTHAGARPFAFDDDRVPVRFAAGENRLVVALDRPHGPWRFAVRVLESGAIVAPVDEIVPSMEIRPDALVIRTHTSIAAGPAVRVEAVGAGGRVLEARSAKRGESVTLATGAWPDGAYEIRCTTETAWRRPFASHLPWYKGDAIATTRRLMAEARVAPPDVRGGHLRMLAALALDRLGGSLDEAGEDAWRAVHAALMEHEELGQEVSGGSGGARSFGFVRLAYADPVDGSTQFCRAYLPAGYDTARTWPAIVYLHGYNPPNPPYVRWWSVDSRHDSVAERHGVIHLQPHGRGNAQYLGIGELDVLRCLDEAEKRLRIDSDRVYLSGDSMGGSGTWIVGSRNAERFAAIAPIFGGWDFRILEPPAVRPAASALTAPERLAREAASSFVSAENLVNTPIFVQHGDSDPAVSVEHSRHVVRMLQRWGYDVRYEEHPGRTHESLGSQDRTVEWLLRHTRDGAPRRTRVRAADLAGARSHWLRVEAREDPLELITADAEVVEPGLIRLDSRNAAAIVLTPPPQLRGADGSVRVVWNGTPVEPRAGRDGAWRVAVHAPAGPLAKRPGQEGLLQAVIATPFALVVGTTSTDPLMRERCAHKAEAFAYLWSAWQGQPVRVFRDDEIGQDEERRYSLVLIGGPEANAVARRLADRLPVAIDAEGVTIDGRRIPAADAVLQMVYPSPFNPDRYVMLVAGTSAAGLYFWNPLLVHPAFGFPMAPWDWTLRDGRRTGAVPAHGAYRAWIAAGVFDGAWRRDDRYVFTGDPALRDRAHRRRAPGNEVAREAGPDAAAFDAYAGRYELMPGVAMTVVKSGRGLAIEAPPLPPSNLVHETGDEFGNAITADAVVFSRDESGRVTGLTLFDGTGERFARRMP